MMFKKGVTRSLENLKWLWRFSKSYRKMFFADLLFAALGALLPLALPQLVKYAMDDSLIKSHFHIVIWCIVFMLVEQALEVMVEYFGRVIGHSMGYFIESDLRENMFEHLQQLSFSYFDNCKTGQLVSRLTSDLKTTADDIHHCATEFLAFALRFVGAFCAMLCTNVQFTLILFMLMPIVFTIIIHFNKKFHILMKPTRQKLGQINAQAENSLLGIKTVQAFTNEELEISKFKKSSRDYVNASIKFIKTTAWFSCWMVFVYGMLYLLLFAIGAAFIRAGQLTSLDVMAYYLYVGPLADTMLYRIPELLEQFQNAITSVVRIREVLTVTPEIKDCEGAEELGPIKGEIEFRDVSFFYDSPDDLVLNGINLKIKPGEKVAVVGASGAGKSSLCNLIPRFYEAKSGQVLIDGVDVKSVKVKSLRSQIGVISQNIYLFADSIASNIAYGKPGASQEEIEQAARCANAEDFILKMPDGYETYVGERGEQLSGGQRQRIGIARAFLKKAQILILDEATSSLDNENEAEVYKSLDELCAGKTAIIIAHRLATIKNADRILVLDKQRIVEEGTHEELINAKGAYYNLYTI